MSIFFTVTSMATTVVPNNERKHKNDFCEAAALRLQERIESARSAILAA